jgi:hypothetical protein
MNPLSYVIKSSDDAILICNNQESAENIFFQSGEFED